MNPTRFNQLVRECIEEVLSEEGRRICAWCKKDMGEYEGQGNTHSICPDCEKQVYADLEKMKQDIAMENPPNS